MDKKTTTSKTNKTKAVHNFSMGRLYVKSTFNNTLVSVTDKNGGVVAWASAGSVGFNGSRKSTPFAATAAIEKVLNQAQVLGIKKLSVYLQGPGLGRDAALRFLRAKREFQVEMISDITPIPHNGPRPPKQRKT
jgi:small subunit ribosomal protein S11